MILISHRANINGKNEATENFPDAIDYAIKLGYDVEVDVWLIKGGWFLGHDRPTYPTSLSWLVERRDKLWVHCKNTDAVVSLRNSPIHYFWHENDCLSLTSKNIIWAFPGKQPIGDSIAVLPEINNDDLSVCIGICSDNIEYHKKNIVKTECSGLIDLYRNLFSEDPKTVLDFGTCDLRDSLVIAQTCPNTKIFAFEPNPEYYKLCVQRNIFTDRLEVINAAISDIDSKIKFYLTLGNIGASSTLEPTMVPHTHDGRVTVIEVDAIRLDGFLNSRNVEVVDLIWMDAQGSELTCLKGMGENLKNVKIIQTEVGVKAYYKNHTLYPEIKAYLADNGFIELGITRDWEYESNAIFINTKFSNGKKV